PSWRNRRAARSLRSWREVVLPIWSCPKSPGHSVAVHWGGRPPRRASRPGMVPSCPAASRRDEPSITGRAAATINSSNACIGPASHVGSVGVAGGERHEDDVAGGDELLAVA